MEIKEIMSRPVNATTTVANAAWKIRKQDVGGLLVGKDNRLLGIVTGRDIVVHVLADGRNANR